MSILDPVQKTMAPGIWDIDRRLLPDIRRQILDKAYTFLDESNLLYAFILGTITGYQYKPDSDVDVQLIVSPPELAEHGPGTLVRRIQEEINGDLLGNSQHPLNFFLYKYNNVEPNWQDATFGVYNVLDDKWEHEPGEASDVRDPRLEYGLELNSAKLILNKFERLVKRWEDDLDKLSQIDKNSVFQMQALNSVKDELKRDFHELVEFCHDLDRQRKLEYSLKWGVPRKNWRNVVFKYIESSMYKDYFEFFKEIKVKDYYTSLYDVVHEQVIDKEPLVSYRANKNRRSPYYFES
jgi:hypothetical protein